MTKNYYKDISNQISDLIKLNSEVIIGMSTLPKLELSEKNLKINNLCKKINNDLIEWKNSITLVEKIFTRQNTYHRKLKNMFKDYCIEYRFSFGIIFLTKTLESAKY